jgi:hypothetical protein
VVKKEEENFEDVLRKLKQKIASKPFISSIPLISKNDTAASPILAQSRGLLSRVRSVENIKSEPAASEENIKTLQSIWQERDSEISKMD